ncbi:MAG: lipopolysaccharide heptosyltransferase II [Clostridia bacterium]
MTADWKGVRRLLCVRLDSLGDVLMTTPALRAFRESLPDCRITLLSSASGAAAARYVPEVDEAIVFAAPWMKVNGADPQADMRFIEALRGNRFDAAVIFTVYSQSALPAAYLCYLAGIPLRLAHCRENPYHLLTDWQPEPEPERLLRHEVERQLAIAAAVGCRPSDERLSFAVPEAARRRVRELALPSPLVVVHPGASAPSRRYPPERFARAMKLVAQNRPCEIVFTGDAGERDLVEAIRRDMAAPSRSLAGELDLGELGALIESADLLVSNNTGPAHLAAALGTPVVDLYALTNPQHTPWRVKSRVLFHDVPCRNCYKSRCPHGHNDCLRRVEPERVAAAAQELLAA